MGEEKEKLVKRIDHWTEHDDEHEARFEEAAEEARSMGLGGAAQGFSRLSTSLKIVTR